MLSKRTKNIIDKFGGIDQILMYARNGGSFSEIEGCGRKCVEELTNCFDQAPLTPFEKGDVSTVPADDDSRNSLIEFYIKRKSTLSRRAQNILAKFESKVKFNDGFVVFNLLSNPMRFIDIKNCGILTEKELYSFFEELKGQLLNDTNFTSEHANEVQLLDFIQIPIDVRGQFAIGSDFDYNKLLMGFIYFSQFRTNYLGIIRSYFFSSNIKSYQSVAYEFSLSRERVRQVVDEFVEIKIDEILNEFRALLKEDAIFFKVISSLKDVSPEALLFHFEGRKVIPGEQLIDIIIRKGKLK